jgi:hypothetical protein
MKNGHHRISALRHAGILFDVNVLIALVDPTHVQYDAAHEWLACRPTTSASRTLSGSTPRVP